MERALVATPLVSGAPTRVLVIEDEPKVASALREGLQAEGYDVSVETTGEGGFYRAVNERFDLLLLDLGLPGRDGLEVLGTLRQRGLKTPVLILTARDAAEDRVLGLDSGADDYLVKPFAFAELLARMRAVLRRGAVDPQRLTLGDLELDVTERTVTRGGVPVDLTLREFELLRYLLERQGQVVSRDALTADVWRETSRSSTLSNVIDVHIARLRRKLDVEESPPLVHTIRGVGFLLSEQTP